MSSSAPFILVINAGSSSLKLAVFTAGTSEEIHKGQIASNNLSQAQNFVTEWLDEHGFKLDDFTGIGHRIVHGGAKYVSPIRVDDRVEYELAKLQTLAPLHQPFGLSALRQFRRIAPGVAHVACFDTAFHATQPGVATRFPIPREYHERGYRRYGFHGLNYEHVAATLPKMTGKPLPCRLLAAHLGNGASMCAILEGRSIATTMGYSTADGLIMGTRTGSIDPGLLIALMRDDNLDAAGLENLLYRQSGLLGLSGISSDMRELLASGALRAKEAIAHYCYSAARHAGSLAVALGGLDAIVFTGGIGENAAPIRAQIMEHLAWLNVEGRVFVVPANEELVIARHVAAFI